MDKFDNFIEKVQLTIISIIATILSVIIFIGAAQLLNVAHHSKNNNVQSLKTIKGK